MEDKPKHPPRETKHGATVDEQVEDSFPASDPPSYSGGSRVGEPQRGPSGSKEKSPRQPK